MIKEQHVIVVPGHGNENPFLSWEINDWTKFGLYPHIFSTSGGDREPYQSKEERLVSEITSYSDAGNDVSIVGISLGGSLSLNTYSKTRDLVSKLVLVSAPLRQGSKRSILSHFVAHNPSWLESMLLNEKNVALLSSEDKKKILVVRGLLDEQVPAQTTLLPDVQNVILPFPAIEHNLNLTLALTLFRGKIIHFLKS